jgi:hypothetical protein
MISSEAERFDVNHPELCPHLRWKSMFVQVEPDPTVPPSNSGYFWCVYTGNCLGPDRNVAEPGNCNSADRACYGTGRCS